jgi:hypothetical protein
LKLLSYIFLAEPTLSFLAKCKSSELKLPYVNGNCFIDELIDLKLELLLIRVPLLKVDDPPL